MFRLIVCTFCALVGLCDAHSTSFTLSFTDSYRENRFVGAEICLPASESTLPLSTLRLDLTIFAHGGGLFAEDYAYECEQNTDKAVIARLVSAEPNGMDLQAMALDMLFLASKVMAQCMNQSSPLHEILSYNVVLAGHSMGAAAALLAAADISTPFSVNASVDILALAPGFWGPSQVQLLDAKACAVRNNLNVHSVTILVGEQDCANSLVAQALPAWKKLTACHQHSQDAPRLTLATLPGATHCQWTSPVKGTCPFDVPCKGAPRLARTDQQGEFLRFASTLGSSGGSAWYGVLSDFRASYVSTVFENESAAAALPTLCPCGNASSLLV